MPIKNHMQSDALLDATQNLDSHPPHIPVMEMLQSSGLPQALAGTDNIKEIEGIRLRGDASSHALLKVFLKVWANQHGYGSAEVRRVVEMIKHGEKYLTGQLELLHNLSKVQNYKFQQSN